MVSLLVSIFMTASPSHAAIGDIPSTAPSSGMQAMNAKGFNCWDLRKASQKLPVHASNLMNRDVTRTAEGGPYKPIDLVCKDYLCTSVPREDFRLMHNPNHPDANTAGYVQMPRVDVNGEVAGLQSAAAEVRLLAQSGACGSTAISSATSAMVKYDEASSIQSDTFNFAVDGRLTSWSRIGRDGKAQHFSFNQDGTIR